MLKCCYVAVGEEIQSQNLSIYSINEVKIRSPEHCLKLERWQGLAHMSKVKPYRIALSFNLICLFSLFRHDNKSLFINFV